MSKEFELMEYIAMLAGTECLLNNLPPGTDDTADRAASYALSARAKLYRTVQELKQEEDVE